MPQRIVREIPPKAIIRMAQSLRAVYAKRPWFGFGKIDVPATLKAIADAHDIRLWESTPAHKELHKQIGLTIMRAFRPYPAGIADDLTLAISIPSRMPFERAVAKQLGHFFLHTDKTRHGEVQFHYLEAKLLEYQALLFAEALIKPVRLTMTETDNQPPTITDLTRARMKAPRGRSCAPGTRGRNL